MTIIMTKTESSAISSSGLPKLRKTTSVTSNDIITTINQPASPERNWLILCTSTRMRCLFRTRSGNAARHGLGVYRPDLLHHLRGIRKPGCLGLPDPFGLQAGERFAVFPLREIRG